MTVARGMRLDVPRAIAVTMAGLAAAVGALMLVLWLAGSTDAIEVKLGDPDFRGIHAADLATEIARNGPVPFPDLAGRDRPIWITHAGDDPAFGWAAFSARVPGREARCLVQWDGTASVFTDSCAPKVTWPPDGDGLDQLAWQVVEGELRVDVGGTRPADWGAGP